MFDVCQYMMHPVADCKHEGREIVIYALGLEVYYPAGSRQESVDHEIRCPIQNVPIR